MALGGVFRAIFSNLPLHWRELIFFIISIMEIVPRRFVNCILIEVFLIPLNNGEFNILIRTVNFIKRVFEMILLNTDLNLG